MKNTIKNKGKRMAAMLLALVTIVSMFSGTAMAAQVNSYHDPAEHWLTASNRTNELDANAVVTHETFYCAECKQNTSFTVWRTPEYTRDGTTAMSRNVKYSDGTLIDGVGTGAILDGTPGKDADYTGYHWTKACCDTCGSMNTNLNITSYGFGKNVYWLYDCAAEFYETIPETATFEQADSTYHLKTTTGGEYCCFCYGTNYHHSSTLEKHNMVRKVTPQIANQRFVVTDTCSDCGYTVTGYVGAKAVIASYFGTVDGEPHTITVSDLSEAGVSVSIRYGNSADTCTMTSAPNYSKEGQYTVYYQIAYTYDKTSMTENGVAYVWLYDESVNNGNGSGNSATCTHKYVYHDTVNPTCLSLGYDRYLCPQCGSIEKKNYTNALGHQWQSVVIRDATCELEGKTMDICHRCGEVKVTYTPKGAHSYATSVVPATCTAPGYTVKECTVCGDRHITNITALKAHNFSSVVTLPTCTTQGYTTKICKDCGLVIHSDYTAKLNHKLSDWIVDKPATATEEGSQHKECVNCGEVTETESIPKLTNQAITNGNGEAIVGGYLVIVTDTDTAKGVMGATVSLSADNKIAIVLPSGRVIAYDDQTTVTVLLKEKKTPVADMQISVTDKNDNFCSEKTDKNGQITIPGNSGYTNSDGKVTIGYEDENGDKWTLTVKVIDYETGRPIANSGVSISKNGTISVVLPDGTDMDANNRITVIVTDNEKKPVKDQPVTVKNDLGATASGKTDKNGVMTVPEGSNLVKHSVYIYGYTDGTFGPSRSMNRAEAAAIFARLLAAKNGDTISESGSASTSYSDIPTTAWYAGYVQYLTGYGVLSGYSDKTFQPNKAITRAEFTAMAVRFFESYGSGDPEIVEKYADFNDVSSGYWAAEYIHDASVYGWVYGYNDGMFHGENQISRAEVVTLMNRMLDRHADEEYITNNIGKLNTFSDMTEKHWAFFDAMEAANGHNAICGEAETWSK